ncbi:hypothetical protein VNO77_49220 [Canavalia gladiata]|uniref:catalase n=1 Tax=Canavalia gladiata TaxID=3824 RepID=A0AAN9JGL9_CANGL
MKEPNTPKIDQLSEEAYVDPIGKTLTSSLGVPVADNQNSLKINEKGPTLLEDFLLRDKLIHFDRERIPERVVHARGVGAHGYFQAYTGNEKWTKAKFLTDTNNRTPIFVRISTVQGGRGSADVVRDARDPDFHRRDLWDAIERGNYPEWELGAQIFSEEDAKQWDFDVLDATKLIPEELVPVTPLGKFVLNKNTDDFSQRQNKLLLVLQILSQANYEPNSVDENWPRESPNDSGAFKTHPEEVQGSKLRVRPESFADHFSQATMHYHSLEKYEQQHIKDAYSFELSKVKSEDIRRRVVYAVLANIDLDLAEYVAKELGIKTPPKQQDSLHQPVIASSKRLSTSSFPASDIKQRKIALLVHDVDGRQNGEPSVTYDAVIVIDGNNLEVFKADGVSKHYVLETYKHLKPIVLDLVFFGDLDSDRFSDHPCHRLILFEQNGTDDQEIPFRTASFKPFVLISNVLESNLESKKYTLASVKLKVYPSQLIKGDADWYNDAELKQYIEEQWSQVFNEISDAYNLGSQVKYPVNMMSGQNYHPVGSAAIPATPRTYTMFGYTFTPIQLVLMVITAILLIYVALALANKYSSNNQTASGQNLYSNASIDKQVQIAEDVVAKVQDRMGVPKLAQSDLGCLQEVN